MLQFVCVKNLLSENPKKDHGLLRKMLFLLEVLLWHLKFRWSFFSWALSQLKADSWWCYKEHSCGYVLDLPFWKNITSKSRRIYQLHVRLKLWQVNWQTLEGELILLVFLTRGISVDTDLFDAEQNQHYSSLSYCGVLCFHKSQ